MFPKKLDGAEVLYYTSKADYGTLKYATGEIYDYVQHLAICQYPDTPNEYYLFDVNDRFEVIGDMELESIEACMANAKPSNTGTILWIKADWQT